MLGQSSKHLSFLCSKLGPNTEISIYDLGCEKAVPFMPTPAFAAFARLPPLMYYPEKKVDSSLTSVSINAILSVSA